MSKNINTYTATPKLPYSIIELNCFGCHVELFFAWFDFWIGIFYDRQKKIIYLSVLPTLILSIHKIRPVVMTYTKIKTGIFMRPDTYSENIKDFIEENPELLKEVRKRIQKTLDDQSRQLWCVGYDPGDPKGDKTVSGETDGKTFREIDKAK